MAISIFCLTRLISYLSDCDYAFVMEDQRLRFNELLNEKIAKLNPKYVDKFFISQSKYNHILEALNLQKGEKCEQGSDFKFWCFKHFKIVNFGSNAILYSLKHNTPVRVQFSQISVDF